MASRRPFSDYYYGLKPEMKKRYVDKLSIIAGQDPYVRNADEFTKDAAPQLILTLLSIFYTTNFATIEEVKNYKSIDKWLGLEC
eukprot:m.239568 g.239568  ORF g.239568 m.239568 type:complete len:84 (+) comp40182_c1_seq44:41-292(+)